MGTCFAIEKKPNHKIVVRSNTLENSRVTDGSTTACHECREECQKTSSRLSKKKAELPPLKKGLEQKSRIIYLSKKIDYKNSLNCDAQNSQKLLQMNNDVQELKLIGHKSNDSKKTSNVVLQNKAHLQKKFSVADEHIAKNNMSFNCQICFTQFDISNQSKIPMLICVQHHNVCMGCINKMARSGKSYCPFDKREFDISQIKKNQIIIDIISHI